MPLSPTWHSTRKSPTLRDRWPVPVSVSGGFKTLTLPIYEKDDMADLVLALKLHCANITKSNCTIYGAIDRKRCPWKSKEATPPYPSSRQRTAGGANNCRGPAYTANILLEIKERSSQQICMPDHLCLVHQENLLVYPSVVQPPHAVIKLCPPNLFEIG
jgi:hypothetical protein